MTKYLTGKIHEDTIKSHSTEKAFYVSIDSGRMGSERDDRLWIPKSKCEVSEPNEVGWCDILVPVWVFSRNRIDYHRVKEITWTAPGLISK